MGNRISRRREQRRDVQLTDWNVNVATERPRVLGETDFPALVTVLGNSAHCAFQLGIQIGLPPDLIFTLEQQALKDPFKLLSLVLGTRMKQRSPPLTLKTLVDALYKPPISNETLALRLLEDFMSDAATEPCAPFMTASGIPVSPAMASYSEFLDSVYQVAAIPPDPKGGPVPGDKYINLAVIKKERVSRAEADEFTKATLHGGIDEIIHEKKAIELKDIFKPENQTKVDFVLAEGAAGVGKSTMAWELCRRRHEIDATKSFAAVVLLRLREKGVQEANSIANLLYHDNPDSEQAIANELRSNQGEGLLFILDGFDEMPAQIRKSCFVAKVISGQYLPKATILVTSRPSARADLLSLRKPDKHIEVLGFTHELIEQYAGSVFASSSALLADFLKYVSTSPAINSMMYIPLNCAIVVEIYQENREVGRPIPQTMTQLYSELILSRISRHLNEGGGHLVSLPEKLKQLAREYPDVHHQLLNLAKLAFDGTLKEEVIFDKLPDGCSSLGLMTVSQQLYVRGRTTVNFFHLTVQEFLAAFHISQLPGSEQKKIFEQHTHHDAEHLGALSHMDVVWRFVAGLTGFEGLGWELVQSRYSVDSRTLSVFQRNMSAFLLESIYEAQEKASCDSVVLLVKSSPRVEVSSTFSSFALGYCIAVSTSRWKVELADSPDTLEMLGYGLRLQEEVRGSIDSLCLSGMATGPNGMAYFSKLPHEILQQLSELILSWCELYQSTLDVLADVVVDMTSLRYLSISGDIDRDEGSAVKLLRALANCRYLHTLHLEGAPLGNEDVTSLSDLIRPPGGLRELRINVSDCSCVRLLLKAALSPSSLQTLILNSDIRDADVTLLFTSLMVNTNIRTLALYNSMATETAITSIAEALRVNTTLEKLELTDTEHYVQMTYKEPSPVVSDEVRDLADAIQVNKSLKELSLDSLMAMSSEEVLTLNRALQTNHTLEKLSVHCLPIIYLFLEKLKTLDPRLKFKP